MLFVNALKTVCDLLLCFSFAGLIASFKEAWPVIGAILALGFLSSLILQKKGGTLPAKLFCALLPALGLFAAKDPSQMVTAGVVLAFYFVLTLSGKNEIYYEDYKAWFGLPAVPALVVFVVCLTNWPIRPAAAVCAGAYLFLGVLVLRRMRMGSGVQPKLRLMNLAELSGIVGLAGGVGALLYTALLHSRKILDVVLMPFALLIRGLIYLFELFGSASFITNHEDTPVPTPTPQPDWEYVPGQESAEPMQINDSGYARAEMLIRIVAIVLALLILAWLLYRFSRLLRRVRLAKVDTDEFEEGEREQQLSRRARRKKRRRLPAATNHEKIRKIYKEYLLLARSCGVEIYGRTTSEEVLTAFGGLAAPAESKRLRELYIRARYDGAGEISDAEVAQAEALLSAIRERIRPGDTSAGPAKGTETIK